MNRPASRAAAASDQARSRSLGDAVPGIEWSSTSSLRASPERLSSPSCHAVTRVDWPESEMRAVAASSAVAIRSESGAREASTHPSSPTIPETLPARPRTATSTPRSDGSGIESCAFSTYSSAVIIAFSMVVLRLSPMAARRKGTTCTVNAPPRHGRSRDGMEAPSTRLVPSGSRTVICAGSKPSVSAAAAGTLAVPETEIWISVAMPRRGGVGSGRCSRSP